MNDTLRKVIPEITCQILNGKSKKDLSIWFEQVDKLRRTIFNCTTLIERLNESPNPYYGVIPFDGSLILCESYGNPQCFYTPLGKWSITGGGFSNGKEAEDILNELGIKWTRLKFPTINEMGQFGGLIQIDEDQFGNNYPPISSGLGFNMDPFFFEDGKKVFYDYYTSVDLFEKINKGNLLRLEKASGEN